MISCWFKNLKMAMDRARPAVSVRGLAELCASYRLETKTPKLINFGVTDNPCRDADKRPLPSLSQQRLPDRARVCIFLHRSLH